jgi:uncharacterized RDD family membrane protein YckC
MNYAGFWIRFLAYVADTLIITIAFVAIVLGLGVMGLELFSPSIIYTVVAIFYWALMQSSKRQATFGKALVGLKVTDADGGRLSVGRALAREAAKVVSGLALMIGYIMAGFTKRKQGLHDMVASTLVVRESPGHVVAALAVGVVAMVAPVVAVIMFGAGLVSGALGELAGGMLMDPQMSAQAPKPPAPAVPKPAAPAAAPKPAATVAAAATPTPAPTMVVAAAAPAPRVVAVAMPVKEPAKPVAEPAKPDPVKEAPKAEPEAPKAEPEAAKPAEPAAEAKPKPEPRLVPVVLQGPSVPGPRYNDLVTAVLYRDAKGVEELLSFGKWADKSDSRGLTPLMTAAELGDVAIAEVLLKAGANPNRPGPGGDTAMTIARERKDSAMVGLLQKHGAR